MLMRLAQSVSFPSMKSISRQCIGRGRNGVYFIGAAKLSEYPGNAFRHGRVCIACTREKDEASVYLQNLKIVRIFCASWWNKHKQNIYLSPVNANRNTGTGVCVCACVCVCQNIASTLLDRPATEPTDGPTTYLSLRFSTPKTKSPPLHNSQPITFNSCLYTFCCNICVSN